MNPKISPMITGVVATVLCMPMLIGCETIGAVGGVVANAMPHYTDAAYKGLAGQPTIVMVWVDPKIKMDNPDLQISVAAGLQDKLIDIARNDSPKALQGTSFPIRAGTVVRYQEDHPELQNELLTTTAAKFDGNRLIYVEITDFDTRSQAVELYRGSMKGNLRVVEMKDGAAKEAYSENDIEIQYPKDSPKEGLPVGTDYKIGQGTIEAFTDEIAKRFYRHEDNP